MNTTTAPHIGIDISSVKQQLSQLKTLHEAGTLTLQAYTEACSVLERRVIDWALNNSSAEPASPASSGASARSRWPKRSLVLALGVAVLSSVAYLWSAQAPGKLSNTLFSTARAQPFLESGSSKPAPHATNVEEISVMAERLAERLKKQPNDAQGWAMLARSYAVMGNQPDALVAYKKAITLLPNDTALQADYAEALATDSKNKAAAKP